MKALYLKKAAKQHDGYAIFDTIVTHIKHPIGIKFSALRENLYTLLSFNIDFHTFVWYTLNELVPYMNSEKLRDVLFDLYEALLLYNNNYRPIYHLEKIVIILIKHIHESPNDAKPSIAPIKPA